MSIIDDQISRYNKLVFQLRQEFLEAKEELKNCRDEFNNISAFASGSEVSNMMIHYASARDKFTSVSARLLDAENHQSDWIYHRDFATALGKISDGDDGELLGCVDHDGTIYMDHIPMDPQRGIQCRRCDVALDYETE